MNWRSPVVIFSLAWACGVQLLGCGVKGDPLPPEKPAELGRGRPTYKRATEGLRIQHKQDVKQEPDEEEDGHE